MGTVYFGPYFEDIDTYDHEGYDARVMPDGTDTGSWTLETADLHIGYRARCDCGWTGATVYPVPNPDPGECEAAMDEWHRDHITPMVEQARRSAWPDWSRRTAERADRVTEYIAAGKYRDAIEVLTAMREDLDVRLRTADQLAEDATGRGGDS